MSGSCVLWLVVLFCELFCPEGGVMSKKKNNGSTDEWRSYPELEGMHYNGCGAAAKYLPVDAGRDLECPRSAAEEMLMKKKILDLMTMPSYGFIDPVRLCQYADHNHAIFVPSACRCGSLLPGDQRYFRIRNIGLPPAMLRVHTCSPPLIPRPLRALYSNSVRSR